MGPWPGGPEGVGVPAALALKEEAAEFGWAFIQESGSGHRCGLMVEQPGTVLILPKNL